MANVWFCSDLHFGHRNIHKFRGFVQSEEDNRKMIVNQWAHYVTKRDVVYVLGDAAFTLDGLATIADLPGRKILIRGNHDVLSTKQYLTVFEEVYGVLKYKEFWLSHAPLHPQELRGKINLHGHVHYDSIDDSRYINCCIEGLIERCNRCFISLDQIRKEVSLDSEHRCKGT